jgi:RNA polymerase sigma-70 factor (ECF subfamily)
MLRHEADASDATQDALIGIVRALDRFDGRAAFGTWCYRIAVNSCLDELRRRKRRPTLSTDIDRAPADSSPDPEHVVTLRDALTAALQELPEPFRTAVVLRDVADLDYAEISQVLDIPIGTVRSRIARGRADLAKKFGNQQSPAERPTSQP